MSTLLYVGIVVYWIGAIADWYTTKRAVFDSSRAKEANPVILWMIEHGAGEWHLLGLKAVVFAILAAMDAPWALAAVGVAQGGAALWNKTVLRHARR